MTRVNPTVRNVRLTASCQVRGGVVTVDVRVLAATVQRPVLSAVVVNSGGKGKVTAVGVVEVSPS